MVSVAVVGLVVGCGVKDEEDIKIVSKSTITCPSGSYNVGETMTHEDKIYLVVDDNTIRKISLHSDFPKLCTTQVTDMSSLFYGDETFNEDISGWDTSNVTTMEKMFFEAEKYNQPLNNWNVSSVSNMSYVFFKAIEFNQPLNSWDVSNTNDINNMFFEVKKFNQPLDNWDVSNVDNMEDMFSGASEFNQDLSTWNTMLINTKPYKFDLDATAWTLPQPIW